MSTAEHSASTLRYVFCLHSFSRCEPMQVRENKTHPQLVYNITMKWFSTFVTVMKSVPKNTPDTPSMRNRVLQAQASQ